MKSIKLDGETYYVYHWQKPEDSDVAFGEAVYAIYPASWAGLPRLAYCMGEGKFRAHDIPDEIQPILILEIPPTTQLALLSFKLGDLRENQLKIKEYYSKDEAD